MEQNKPRKDKLLQRYKKKGKHEFQLVAHDGRRVTEPLVGYSDYDIELSTGTHKKTEFVGLFPLELPSLVEQEAHPPVPIETKVARRPNRDKLKAISLDPPVGSKVRVLLANGWAVVGVIQWFYAYTFTVYLPDGSEVWFFKHAVIDLEILEPPEASEEGAEFLAKWSPYRERTHKRLQHARQVRKRQRAKRSKARAAAGLPPLTAEKWESRKEGPFTVWQRQSDGAQLRRHPAWDHWKLFLGPGKVLEHPGDEPPFGWANEPEHRVS